MKAKSLVFTGVGQIQLQERDVPDPQPSEILVKTKLNGICAFEIHAFTGELPVDWFPAVMGHEAVGVVADVGREVTRFRPGDPVSTLGFASFSEYYTVAESQAEKIPERNGGMHLWLGEPTACVVNGIRLIEERNPGSKMTIIGCGFMGLMLVQLAVHRGLEVIARDVNSDRLALAQSFGARTEAPEMDSQDVTIECSGSIEGLTSAEYFVRNGGVPCLFAHHLPARTVNTNLWHMKGLDVLNATPAASRDWTRDFHDALEYIRQGVLNLGPLITHFFDYREPQSALDTITRSRPADYIKGVFTFED